MTSAGRRSPQSDLRILNPKRGLLDSCGRSNWYPYYAGFSIEFAQTLISTAPLQSGSVVLDPWNGSGTTTAAAQPTGFRAFGFDLNPAMVVVSKARLLPNRERSLIVSTARTIVERARRLASVDENKDALLQWFAPAAAVAVRQLEVALRHLVADSAEIRDFISSENLEKLPALAAFFYIAVFRTMRTLLSRFVSSNPTWVKTPGNPAARLRTRREDIFESFTAHVTQMAQSVNSYPPYREPGDHIRVSVAPSEALPTVSESVDLVLGSPPYCTRVDYAVATRPELALLGFSGESFRDLRRRMTGTSMVPAESPELQSEWGQTCHDFLERVRKHQSKASAGYYHKNHAAYFTSIWLSIAEIARVLKTRGSCVLVVQDSFYKDVYNDLPQIVIEMAQKRGLHLERRVNFEARRSMVRINTRARRQRTEAISESVLCFSKLE